MTVAVLASARPDTRPCNNFVPVNVLGVQVALEDIAGNIPIVAESNNAASNGDETCGQCSIQEN